MLKFKSVSRIKKLKFKWVFIGLESGANMLAAPPSRSGSCGRHGGVEIGGVIVLGQKSDVMAGDSLLTPCCPSASSADTNTSNLFQLRPALLSQSIAPPPLPPPTPTHKHACHRTSGLTVAACPGWDSSLFWDLPSSVGDLSMLTQARYFDYARCGRRNAYSQEKRGL